MLIVILCAARHVLCQKQGKINEAYKKLQDGWLSNGDKVPLAEFAKASFQNLNKSVACDGWNHYLCSIRGIN